MENGNAPGAKIVSLAEPMKLPALEWQEYLGQTLGIGVYLVAFHDGATEPELSYEIGFSEPDEGLTNAAGEFIPGVWAVARLDDPND